MALFGVVVLSPDSLMIRLARLDDHTLLFYRGLLPAITISILLWLYYRDRFFGVIKLAGWFGILNGVLFAAVNVTFISAIQRTSVAMTLLLLASAPVFAGILSWLILRETLRKTTWVIIGFSMISVFIISLGSHSSGSLYGAMFALGCAILTAASAVLVRYKKELDLIPSVILGSLLTAMYALGYSIDFAVTVEQFIYLGIIGVILVPVAFVLLTIAPRFANSAEVQLVYLLESMLGPLWVWLVLSEVPATQTLVGGSMLLLCIAWFIHESLQSENTANHSQGNG